MTRVGNYCGTCGALAGHEARKQEDWRLEIATMREGFRAIIALNNMDSSQEEIEAVCVRNLNLKGGKDALPNRMRELAK